MWVDPYMFVTLASGIALIAFAGQLCGIYIPYGEETSKLRIARAILAVSYLILSVGTDSDFHCRSGRFSIIAVHDNAVDAAES